MSSRHFRVLILWIQTFIPLGDGVRRIVSRILCDEIEHKAFFDGLSNMPENHAHLLGNLIGSLVNDHYFASHFVVPFCTFFPSLCTQVINAAQSPFANSKSPPLTGLNAMLEHSFHFMNEGSFEIAISNGSVSWTGFYFAITDIQLRFLRENGSFRVMQVASTVFWNHWYLSKILKCASRVSAAAAQFPAFLDGFALILSASEASEPARIGVGHTDPREAYASCSAWFTSWAVYARKFAFWAPCNAAVLAALLDWSTEHALSPDGSPLDASVLTGRVPFSPMLALHVLFNLTLRQAPDAAAALRAACGARGIDFEVACRAVCVFPLRWIAAAMLVSDGRPAGLPKSIISANATIMLGCGATAAFMRVFVHIQFMFSLCADKDSFLRMVTRIFGVSDPLEFATRAAVDVACINFVSALLCDRAAWQGAKREWIMNATMIILRAGDRTVDFLGWFLSPFQMTESALGDQLKHVTRVADGRVSLSDSSKYHIAQCCNFQNVIEAIGAIAEADRENLLPFPAWADADGLGMGACLRNRFLFAFVYDILYRELTQPSLALHYALNIFILLANQTPPFVSSAPFSVVVADSVDALAAGISDNFHEFLRTPVYYRLGIPATVVQIIEKFGTLGAKVLVHSNIGWSRKSVAKPNIAELKRTILGQFEQQKLRFEEVVAAAPSPDRCAVCQSTDPADFFVYPCVCFLTGLPSLIVNRTEGTSAAVAARQAFCCTHKLHYSCFMKIREGQEFTCPVCSCRRNAAIPAFSPDLREFRLQPAADASLALLEFLLAANLSMRLTEVLAMHIIILDARAAARPEVLDQEDVTVLYRNLFLAMVLGMKSRRVLRPGVTPLGKLIGNSITVLMNNIDAEIPILELAKAAKRDDLAFYRQVTLFWYFMLGRSRPVVIDWDETLDPATLALKFRRRSLATEPRPRLQAIPLPDDWVDLLLAPFNYDITDMAEEMAVCLFTGEQISLSGFGANGRMTIAEYLNGTMNGGPTLLLHISGFHATRLAVASLEASQFVSMKPAWLDQLGMPDIGLDQGRLLSLNRSLLAEILDDVASGKFCNGVHQL
jgi:hypothetical protein